MSQIILLQSRYSALKNNELRGIQSESALNLTRNKITAGLIDMISGLKDSDLNLGTIADLKPLEDQNTPIVDNSNQISSDSNSVNSGIYISYAWGGESEEIVNLLDTELQKKGVNLIRDKRDLGYKGSIVGFMEDIGRGNKIIVVISKKYLESENCMFELTQIYENKDFAKRIFPIVLEDADIYSPISRIKYIKLSLIHI